MHALSIILYFSPVAILAAPLLVNIVRTIQHNRMNGFRF